VPWSPGHTQLLAMLMQALCCACLLCLVAASLASARPAWGLDDVRPSRRLLQRQGCLAEEACINTTCTAAYASDASGFPYDLQYTRTGSNTSETYIFKVRPPRGAHKIARGGHHLRQPAGCRRRMERSGAERTAAAAAGSLAARTASLQAGVCTAPARAPRPGACVQPPAAPASRRVPHPTARPPARPPARRSAPSRARPTARSASRCRRSSCA
jgi:hypothetical protein